MVLTEKLLGSSSSAEVEPIYVEDVFSTYLYTGNGSTQTITNDIDLASEGGLVWLKRRTSNNGTAHHRLYDSDRGAGSYLYTSGTDGETYTPNGLTNFLSNGFTIGSEASGNGSGDNYASWTFRKAPKFFDIVTWTGTGSSQTLQHNLQSVPGVIISRAVDGALDWWTYHRSLDTFNLKLNTTDAAVNLGFFTGITSTTFTSPFYTNGVKYIAYLFAHDAGGFGDDGTENIISCGSYTTGGTGKATVNLGWEPQWLLVKRYLGTGGWYIADTMRAWNLTAGNIVFANTAGSEFDDWGGSLYPTATGFQDNGVIANSSEVGYIAIRRGPMKTPTDATKVFELINLDNVTSGTQVSNTVIPDMALHLNDLGGRYVVSRLTGGINTASSSASSPRNWLQTYNSDPEDTSTTGLYYNMQSASFNVAANGADPGASFNLSYFLSRAPGFLDVVAYTGTGSARTVSHNLGVAPELIIVKKRSGGTARAWAVYANNDNTDYLVLNTNAATADDNTYWNDTSPTSTEFTVGTANSTNESTFNYIAYLFATCPGVSKVGSYTGSGTTKQIDCGFTAGARFVMIKRVDSTGDWYFWDSARGIVAGDDPYLLINSQVSQVTNTDYVDTYSAGFEISSTAPAAINANGGTFIFLAIA